MNILSDLLFFTLAFLINPIAYLLLIPIIILAIYWCRKILFWFPVIIWIVAILFLTIEKLSPFGYAEAIPNFYDFLYHTSTIFVISSVILPIAGLIISKKQDGKLDMKFLYYIPLYVLLATAMFIVNWHYLTYIP